MRIVVIALSMLMLSIGSALGQVSVAIGIPGLSIGINVPVYPRLVPVPGYPVYYAPGLNSNFFFYDGMYWVYQSDNWYASSWYNGPWQLVGPDAVPVVILRVPVRYYRVRPAYFRGWALNAPPRWGQHWGNAWEQQHRGWEQRDRRAQAPRAAPLPNYQRQYSGKRYPQANAQPQLQARNYRYQPRDATVQQRFEPQRGRGGPAESAPRGKGAAQDDKRGQERDHQ
jgi:hypothetical protein